jgi:hypothetical protein
MSKEKQGELLAIIIGIFLGIVMISFMLGLLEGGGLQDGEVCEYNSILDRINPAYFIGCELTEPRYD